MKFSTLLLAAVTVAAPLLATSAYAVDTSRPAIKDSTILRSGRQECPACPGQYCNKCKLGHEQTLKVELGLHNYWSTLVGFQLPVPAASITKCTVQFPGLKELRPSPLDVTISTAASNNWNEDTVAGENAPQGSPAFVTVSVPAYSNIPEIDITPACKSAGYDGQFSIYLSAQAGDSFEISSKESGNPAILHITHN
ncbi:hypothetical protein GQ42DRAFT_127487 [Ramicandelaber brevisporus]|nr:hypothetical protein GQ42DRAFT_127487 [Ramicandelaber brevisporus]